MGKRKRKTTPTSTPTPPPEFKKALLEKVQNLSENEMVQILALIANQDIKTPNIKRSFSAAKWSDLAKQFGFADSFENNVLVFESVITPVYNLPPSFHVNMFEMAWRSQDVYQERMEQSRVRIMDPYLVPIIGLFQGRVIDNLKPEERMRETDYSSGGGGEVEHEIFMIGGILFVIAEFKLVSGVHLKECVAQLFFEILSAAKLNEDANFANLRVYGLLTDNFKFHFYSYDPLTKKFAYDVSLDVNFTRDVAFPDMIPVCNKIFGVILTAFIDGLGATLSKSREREKKGDVSSSSSAPLYQLQLQRGSSEPGPSNRPLTPSRSNSGGRKSTDCWEIALKFAQECRDKFNEPVDSVDEIEQNSTAALELLAKSVRSIARVSPFSGEYDPSSPEELRELARNMVKKKHLDIIGKKKLP